MPTKVRLVKNMVFPVVMYGCESWTIKKAEIESEVAQSCPTLCDPMDCSSPGSSVHGILQARILEGLPFPSPGDLLDPGIEPRSPTLGGGFFITEPPRKPRLGPR